MGIASSKLPLPSLFCAKPVIPFSCFNYSILLKTTAHILWLMPGRAAIVHRNCLRTWLIKFFCKPPEAEDNRENVAASGLGISMMPQIILSPKRVTFIDEMCLTKV
jgi:hypothetical protein